VRQAAQAELVEAGQELLELLSPEQAEDQLGGVAGAAPAHDHQDESGQIRVIDRLHRAVAAQRPLGV